MTTTTTTSSQWILNWSAFVPAEPVAVSGLGDDMIILWRRGDGEMAIETNADPYTGSAEEVQAAWAAELLAREGRV